MTPNDDDRRAAEQLAETVFALTRHACAVAVVERAKLVRDTRLYQSRPDIVEAIEGIFEALGMVVCEVRLDPAWVDEAAQKLPPHRLAADRRGMERAAGIMDERVKLYEAKAERRDPLGEDEMNRWEGFRLCAEASEYGAAAIRAEITKGA